MIGSWLYIYIYIHVYTHKYIHIHTYIQTYIHTHIHTYIHTDIHTCTHTYIHAHIHTYIWTYIHTHKHTHTHIIYVLYMQAQDAVLVTRLASVVLRVNVWLCDTACYENNASKNTHQEGNPTARMEMSVSIRTSLLENIAQEQRNTTSKL